MVALAHLSELLPDAFAVLQHVAPLFALGSSITILSHRRCFLQRREGKGEGIHLESILQPFVLDHGVLYIDCIPGCPRVLRS